MDDASQRKIRLLVWVLALLAGCASAILCRLVLGSMPHIPDELAYLYQGKIFASGKLSVEVPSAPDAFTSEWDHILRTGGRWRTIYPPGWPLLLAVGWLIHAPWIINPLLVVFSTAGIFHVARLLFDVRTGLYSVIAFVASPIVLLMGAGFMSHQAALCFSIWCVFFLIRATKNDSEFSSRTMKNFALAGLFGAFAFVIRPYTATTLLLPAFIWSTARAENRLSAIVNTTLGATPLLLLFIFYNYLQFDHVFRTGYAFDPDARFRGSLTGYFFQHVPWYWSNINRSLWGFPWPDLLILLPLVKPHEGQAKDALLFLCFVCLMFAYSFFYYTDIVYSGPRYVFEAVGFLVILVARGIVVLSDWFKKFSRRIRIGFLLLFIYPLFVILPQAMSYHEQGYHGQPQELVQVVKQRQIDNALILIAGDPFVYRTFFLQNALEPQKGPIVFAKDIPALREELYRAYPRKEVWRLSIQLTFIPGQNQYSDRSAMTSLRWEKLR